MARERGKGSEDRAAFPEMRKEMLGVRIDIYARSASPRTNCKSTTYMIVVPIITILTKGYGNGRSWSKSLESSVDIFVLDLKVINPMPPCLFARKTCHVVPSLMLVMYTVSVDCPPLSGKFMVSWRIALTETGARTVFFAFCSPFEVGCETEALITKVLNFATEDLELS